MAQASNVAAAASVSVPQTSGAVNPAARKVVTVVGLTDVVGALSAGTLANNLFLFDNNQVDGSFGHGTGSLTTFVGEGDLVAWVCMPLECEAFARIMNVRIDKRFEDYIALDCQVYERTSIVYWVATIKKPLPGPVPYRLEFRLGSRPEWLDAPVASYLRPLPACADKTAGTPAPEPAPEQAKPTPAKPASAKPAPEKPAPQKPTPDKPKAGAARPAAAPPSLLAEATKAAPTPPAASATQEPGSKAPEGHDK
jgi:hypothetical protein